MKRSVVVGFNAVVRALDKKAEAYEDAYHKGAILAGLFLQAESQKLVPVDTGVLRNSAFTRYEGEGFQTVVYVGYLASYAIYVHENLEARHEPGKQAKYLEQPAREKRPEMQEIIYVRMKAA